MGKKFKIIEVNMNAVYRVEWIESERGWGQRPDGVSLHKNKEEMERFVQNYESKGSIDCYSRAIDKKLIEVDETIYREVQMRGSMWERN